MLTTFEKYVRFELGMEEMTRRQRRELKRALKSYKRQLQAQEYRLLSLDNFKAAYGKDSGLLITTLDLKSWYEIAIYKNPEV